MAAFKYPWTQWFSKPCTVLVRGADYTISQAIMYQTIRNNARKRDLKVRITDMHEGFTIEILHPNKAAITGEPSTELAGAVLL